jgi:hypothetical protein
LFIRVRRQSAMLCENTLCVVSRPATMSSSSMLTRRFSGIGLPLIVASRSTEVMSLPGALRRASSCCMQYCLAIDEQVVAVVEVPHGFDINVALRAAQGLFRAAAETVNAARAFVPIGSAAAWASARKAACEVPTTTVPGRRLAPFPDVPRHL